MTIKSLLLKNTSINVGSYIYLLLASFWSISVLLANLGSERLGIYLLIIAIIPLASVLDIGTGIAIIRQLALPDVANSIKLRVWRAGLGFALLRALLLGVGVWCLHWLWLSHIVPLSIIGQIEMWRVVALLSLIVAVDHVNVMMLSLPQARQEFGFFNIKTLLVGTANTIGSAVLSFWTQDISMILTAQLVAHSLTGLALAWYSRRVWGTTALCPSFDVSRVVEIIRYGLKNFVGVLASQIEAQISKIVLGTYVSAGAVASFAIPQSIVLKGSAIVSQVAQVMLPMSASLLSSGRVDNLKKLIFGIQTLVLSIGIMAVGASLWWGESFLLWWLRDVEVVYMVLPVLKMFGIYYLFTSLTPIPTVLMQSINKPHIPSLFALLTLTIEIILMIIFVPSMQLMGVVFATVGGAMLSVPPFLIVSYVLFEREVDRIKKA
jgi:O-antigen/teichoic acid export membrane protein